MGLLIFSNANVALEHAVDPMSLFKYGRDSTGIKCRRCIVRYSCRQEVQWFHKKSEMEANLEKAHAIHVILPRGLKIEEEEQSTSGLSTSTSFFNDYERQRWIQRFMNPELKYMRSRQSYMRKLRTRGVNHSIRGSSTRCRSSSVNKQHS